MVQPSPPPVAAPCRRCDSHAFRVPTNQFDFRAYLPTPKPSSLRVTGHPRRRRLVTVGRRVDGVPAIYETTLRPDAIHTSYVVGVAWMDTKLLRATLYSAVRFPWRPVSE